MSGPEREDTGKKPDARKNDPAVSDNDKPESPMPPGEEDHLTEEAVEIEQRTGAPGPTNWWRFGLVVLAGLVVLLIVLQLVTGGDVTPVEDTPGDVPAAEDTQPAEPDAAPAE